MTKLGESGGRRRVGLETGETGCDGNKEDEIGYKLDGEEKEDIFK